MGSISEDCVIISSQVLSQEITSIVGGTKIDARIWECIEILGSTHESLGEMELIEVRSSLVNIFSHVTPKEMADFQQADKQISVVYPWVQDGKTPTKAVQYKTRSKTTRKLFHQFETLTLKKKAGDFIQSCFCFLYILNVVVIIYYFFYKCSTSVAFT